MEVLCTPYQLVGEGVARRCAEDTEQLAEGTLAGAGGHKRERRVDGQQRLDEVAAPAGVVGEPLVEAERERFKVVRGRLHLVFHSLIMVLIPEAPGGWIT